jgi:hypothetical protein
VLFIFVLFVPVNMRWSLVYLIGTTGSRFDTDVILYRLRCVSGSEN